MRVLQEQELERIGDTRTRKVSVRVIAATNRDLKKEVDQGRFREGLFYRLSVFPIEAPPLRKRSDDIAKLAAHFIRQRAAEEGDRDGARRAGLSLRHADWLRQEPLLPASGPGSAGRDARGVAADRANERPG